jgi:predicted N-formylglutamate amidohydrolase
MSMSTRPRRSVADEPLLAAGEPAPWHLDGAQRRSACLFICDHAGSRIPRRLARLGLSKAQIERHIGWDIGAAALGRMLAKRLDAPLIVQRYSRLVIDCNRPLHSAESIVRYSDGQEIPGNRELSRAEADRRAREIFTPYHDCIRRTLDTRQQHGRPTLLISLHSFTPVLAGVARPWDIGLLYHRDARIARALLPLLRAEPGLVVGDNEPYALGDDSDYSIPEHGERRGLLHVEIEIRQDLIADAAGRRQWAQRLARLLLPLETAFAPLADGMSRADERTDVSMPMTPP